MVLSKWIGVFSADLGIDLGTSNTRVCVRGKGLVLSEPSVVAVKRGTQEVLMNGRAIGQKAKDMLGRTPESIDAIRPLRQGVIADFEMTQAMLAHFMSRACNGHRLFGQRVVIAIPTGINSLQKRAVFNAADRAGARKVYLIEEPRAAGLGAGVPIHEARAHMIVDVGGGTTDITVVSLADIVVSTPLRVAGDAMDEAIAEHIRKNYNILIGSNLAEEIKIQVGSACPTGEEATYRVAGRDLIAGLPRSVTVTADEIREALSDPVDHIVEGIRRTLEKTGPELSGDLLETGLTLCGGGVLLRGLSTVVEEETGLPVKVDEDPLTTVVRGISLFLEKLDDFKHILESGEDDL